MASFGCLLPVFSAVADVKLGTKRKKERSWPLCQGGLQSSYSRRDLNKRKILGREVTKGKGPWSGRERHAHPLELDAMIKRV